MTERLSNAQLERLGKRLVESAEPLAEDLQVLHELLLARSDLLEEAIARVRSLGVEPSSRVKNTGTILEKLQRQGGWTLATMQDLAGMRVEIDDDRRGQDDVVEEIAALFADESRTPRIIDRRVTPMHGYRAVHIIVFLAGAPIEIQVRTRWQHEWAELFEKLADRVGRGIRYGAAPDRWWTDEEFASWSPPHQRLARAAWELYDATVKIATGLADVIDAVEQAHVEVPDAPELPDYRRRVVEELAYMREAIEELGEI